MGWVTIRGSGWKKMFTCTCTVMPVECVLGNHQNKVLADIEQTVY